MEITLSVSNQEVWEEVAKTTAYTGDKMFGQESENAYDRILMTDEDRDALQRFWEDAATIANGKLKEMLVSSSQISGDYIAKLHVSNAYDTVLDESIKASLRSYFIAAILAKWSNIANKADVGAYSQEATAMMDDVLRKLYSRKRPQRPNREK